MYLEINHDPSYSIPGQYQFNFSFLKGQSNQIFDLHFFPYSKLLGPLTNGKKYFLFWFRFRGNIWILGLKKWLTGVWFPWESCFGRFLWTRQGMTGEIDSPGYHTPGRLTRRGIKPWGDWKIWKTRLRLYLNRKYFNPFFHGPGVQTMKKWRSKILLTVPFKRAKNTSRNSLHSP